MTAVVPPKNTPLTVRQVIDELERLAAEVGDDLPVHILVMHDEEVERCWYGNLVTHVETDQYDEDQGLVVDLMAWPECFTPNRVAGRFSPPDSGRNPS